MGSVCRRRAVGLWATALLLLATLPAQADPDYRLGDRFFFGLYGGVATTGAGQISDTYHPYYSQQTYNLSSANVSATHGAYGYVTSFWPNDYLGTGVDLQFFTLPPPSRDFATMNVSFGIPLRLAVPLRYVQPYVGAWGGFSTTWVGTRLNVDPAGSGADLHYRLLAGSNVYINRNLRLFVEYQYQPLGFSSASPTQRVSYQAAHADLLLAGALWSPDFYHAARPLVSLDVVWASVAGEVALWGLLNLIGRNR